MSTTPPPISYEKTTRWRSWARQATLPLIVITLGLLALLYGPSISRHVELLRWQRRAMRFDRPEDQVVYEADPARARPLLRSFADMEATNSSGAPVYEFSRTWREFFAILEPPGRKPGALLFLHERLTPKGQRRLVAVDLPARSQQPAFHMLVFRPGTMGSNPALLDESSWMPPFLVEPRPAGLRIMAGEIDPRDASHFTIAWQADTQSGVIDGYLLENDRVILESRQ